MVHQDLINEALNDKKIQNSLQICKETPKLKRWKEQRLLYPQDTLILTHTGHFYELYFQDAYIFASLFYEKTFTFSPSFGYQFTGFVHTKLEEFKTKLTEEGFNFIILPPLSNKSS